MGVGVVEVVVVAAVVAAAAASSTITASSKDDRPFEDWHDTGTAENEGFLS